MTRSLAFAGLLALTLVPSEAFADSIAITSGNGFLYWDSSLTSVIVASSDSQFVTESHTGSDGGFAGGATVDLSTTIPFTNQGFHPLAQTYHGQQFQAWVSGSMQIVAKPFVAPHAPPNADGTFQAFTTTFTMSGTITGWATSDRTGTPLFTTSLTGRGIITAGPYRVTGDSYVQRNGDFLAFDSPSSPPCNAWASHDVGAVGTQGGAGACDFGKIDVFGSGADIWGTADAFQFLSLPIAADGQIVAQLTSPVQNTASGDTSTFAKAGLMIRQTLDPGSPEVILDVRPGGGIEFMTRSVAGDPTTYIAGGSTSFPVWLRLSRRGQLVEGDVSADGTAWTTVGSTLAAGDDALVGLAVTSHDTSARDLGSFTQVGLWRLPSGWSQQDVGAVGPAGTATATDGVFTVAGAGSDIWGSMDAFNAVTGTIGQQATLVARVVDEQDTQMFAKAGVTFGSPTPSAARVILDVRPDGNIEFMSRLADDGVMSFIGGASVAFPVWLRLVRAGDQVTGSISSDGSAWTAIGSVNVALPASVAGGLAVTSHDTSQLNTATFDNVTLVIDGSSPPNLLQDPGFESSVPPSFASPGWTSDTVRQTPAQSETSEPHSGAMNGACRTTSALDCGIYQDVVAPADGHYTFTVYGNASRDGAWIGVNVNNAGVQSAPVEVPGSAVIDDASLTY